MQCNIPEERCPQLHRGRGLKSRRRVYSYYEMHDELLQIWSETVQAEWQQNLSARCRVWRSGADSFVLD